MSDNRPAVKPIDPNAGSDPGGHVDVAKLCTELSAFLPFAQMTPKQVEAFVRHSTVANFSSDDTLLRPAWGAVQHLHCVLEGTVIAREGLAEAAGGFRYEAGDLFPASAALGGRPVTATYVAHGPVRCLLLPVQGLDALLADSPPLALFLQRRVMEMLALSRQAGQAGLATQALVEQTLESSLGALARRPAVSVPPGTALRVALQQMHEHAVGSVMVAFPGLQPVGILTRYDVLGRVTLAARDLDDPIDAVMSAPVHSLDVEQSAQDAMLLMSLQGIRHVPITEKGQLVGVVSERDLFALQRLSLRQVSAGIAAATDPSGLQACAKNIRSLARQLLEQGVQARQLTALISHLNDRLAERMIHLCCSRHQLDLSQACWLAFGSEGRGEQTIATDQDNGLVFVSDDPNRDRPRWLAMAREVNEGLDACGYPLCPGFIMASQPACCLTEAEWIEQIDSWVDHGGPQDLLKASIYFDLRGIAGHSPMAQRLRGHLVGQASRLPRFIKQLALNALSHRPPLNWRGAIDTHIVEGRAVIDLKLQGTAIFVDVARIYALAQGIAATGTRQRLADVGQALNLTTQESEAWITAFEYLQALRLRVQIAQPDNAPQAAPAANLVDVAALNDIDRRMLREALRAAKQLQQRLKLDYER